MRALHKSWSDKRPGDGKRFKTKWVRWYQQNEPLSIRLNFYDADEHRMCNMFYTSVEAATADYEAFIAGETSIRELLA